MFVAYGAVQLPNGVALDLIGPRRVQAALSLVAAAGFAIFALADGYAGFSVARIVLGIGVSAGLGSGVKGQTQRVSPPKNAQGTGNSVGPGGVGGIFTPPPGAGAPPGVGRGGGGG